jgi:hypothetical protein
VKTITGRRKSQGKITYDHAVLEEAILDYQGALQAGDRDRQTDAYERICRIYRPQDYISKWYPHYKHLFDSEEDFRQDYMRVFCTTLAAWKPRHLRKPSRYGGKGHFQNFFWGALSHAYINGVKSEAAAKRNLSQRCPLCGEWCNPLSTHLLSHHSELLWQHIEDIGYNLRELRGCPFCQSFKVPKKGEAETEDAYTDRLEALLKKHTLSMHSSVLFEYFHDRYPDYVTVSARPVSIYGFDPGSGDESNAYEGVASRPGMTELMALDLSEVQLRIIERILNGVGAEQVSYHADFGCSEEEFEEELEGLKVALVIAGLEG